MEDSDFLSRCFLKGNRPFSIHVALAGTNVPFLEIERPYTCWWLSHMRIKNPQTNQLCGTVKEEFSICVRKYSVLDANGVKKYHIYNHFCSWTFYIEPVGQPGNVIGQISKDLNIKDAFFGTDTFGVTVPPNLSTQDKCLILGAVFLIQIGFEKARNAERENRRNRSWF